MSLEGSLSNDEVRNIIAKHAREGPLTPEKYKELIELYSKPSGAKPQNIPVPPKPTKNVQPKKKSNPILMIGIGILIVCIIYVLTVYSHPGRTDSNGGHYNRSTGEYHYHTGENAGKDASTSSNSTETYIGGYNAGRKAGYNTGYNEGYSKGYEAGYKSKEKEVDKGNKKTLGFLLVLFLAIVLVDQIIKNLKKHK